ILTPKLQRKAATLLVDYINHLHRWKMNYAAYDWLILTRSTNDYKYINNVLNTTELRFDQNIVLQKTWDNDSSDVGITVKGTHILQYFKARVNSTLYAAYLGKWNKNISMAAVKVPYPVEVRNVLGEKINVGRSNSSHDDNYVLDENFSTAHELWDDILHFITKRMNTTPSTQYYSKLGSRTYEGVWSGLLGALSDNSIDIAFEPVTEQTLTERRDLDFVFPIAKTMCNIYIRNQETSAVRDIFLAPFSSRLLVCVIAVIIVTSLAVVVISRLTIQLARNKRRKMEYTEAMVWSMGIICQQGGSWTPRSPSASILLIVCLFFAVITYNAYAAFITSVLSVRVATVATVADVLRSNEMKIGYIRNGPDQIYLMSTKDIQLNEFYIRGYSEAENLVTSAEEGLSRAASQDYAFFAGQLVARTTLRSLSQARGRCALRELPVPSTRTDLSFPLPHCSAYAKPILLSLLQLRSSGVLSRLAAALVPAMPQCSPLSGFASARAADVRTAYLVIIAGFIISIAIGVGEYAWKNRKNCRATLHIYFKRMLNMF
ncbi:glutamate receptor ionotropic, kainate 1-like, partial [Leptidea sinapis]|uniref:glutamate receptor ionotropic, kainate 1-like n=1 Tax=Leptidea sinapis TaxID=189913 RepID=UPI0021C38685